MFERTHGIVGHPDGQHRGPRADRRTKCDREVRKVSPRLQPELIFVLPVKVRRHARPNIEFEIVFAYLSSDPVSAFHGYALVVRVVHVSRRSCVTSRKQYLAPALTSVELYTMGESNRLYRLMG